MCEANDGEEKCFVSRNEQSMSAEERCGCKWPLPFGGTIDRKCPCVCCQDVKDTPTCECTLNVMFVGHVPCPCLCCQRKRGTAVQAEADQETKELKDQYEQTRKAMKTDDSATREVAKRLLRKSDR